MSTTFDALTNVTADLDGAITNVYVFDPDNHPNRVLPRAQAWRVQVNWHINGLVAPGIGGDWQIQVILESMGPGYEGILAQVSVPVSNAAPATTRNYQTTITLPAPNTIAGFLAGAYKLVVIVKHTITGGGITLQTQMAGFYEGPLLEFYDPQV